jgi:hypothetical protein
MDKPNDMTEMANRASQIVDSIASAMMSAAEVAAQKIQLASDLASMKMRLDAFGSVLDAIDAERTPLLEAMEAASGGKKAFLKRRIEMLNEQEMSVLEKASVPTGVARQVVGKVTKGMRFPAVEQRALVGSLNGNGDGDEIDVKDL